MAVVHRETLSPVNARVRLVELGARLQRRDSGAHGQLYWSSNRQLWVLVQARPNGQFDLQYHQGCGC